MAELGTEFIRLGKTLADTEVSRKRPDLYNSMATTYKIKGGQDTKTMISTFNIPSAPPYGSSELRALDYYFYTDSIGIGNAVAPIRLAAYKFKNVDDVSFDATKLTKNTGLSKGTSPTVLADDTLFFTATAKNEPLDAYSDDFNGVDNKLLGDADYTTVQRKMFLKLGTFMHMTDFMMYATREPGIVARRSLLQHDVQIRSTEDMKNLRETYTLAKLLQHHGTEIERGTGEGKNTTNIIKLQSKDKSRWRTKINKDDSDHKYISKNDAEPLLETNMLMESDDNLYGDEVTPQNSIFSSVRGSKEVYQSDSTGGDVDGETKTAQINMTAGVKYVSENNSSGKCARFYAFHRHGVSTDVYKRLSAKDEAMNTADGENGSDAVAVIKNVPAPYNIGPPIPGVLAHVSESGHTFSEEAESNGLASAKIGGPMIAPGIIEFDFNIPELAPGFVYASSKAELSIIGRSLTFIMSSLHPTVATQRLRDYLDDVTGKTAPTANNDHSYWGISFIKDKNGIIRAFDHQHLEYTTNKPTSDSHGDYHITHADANDDVVPIPENTPLRMTWSESDCLDLNEKVVQISEREDSLSGSHSWNVIGTMHVKGYSPDASENDHGDGMVSFGDSEIKANLTNASDNKELPTAPGHKGCRHLSIWLTNHENKYTGANTDGGAENNVQDMTSKVDFDRIEFMGYNNSIQNATTLSATGENKYVSNDLTHELATIPYAPTAYYGYDLGKTVGTAAAGKNWLAGKPETLARTMLGNSDVGYGECAKESYDESMTAFAYNVIPNGPTSTAMCFGFSSQTHFDQAALAGSKYLFLQGFRCSTLSKNTAIDENLISGGYTIAMSDTSSYAVPLGMQNYAINISPKLTPSALLINSDTIGSPGSTATDINMSSSNYDISGFTEKGFLEMKFDSGQAGPNGVARKAPAARECVYASARILRAKEEAGGVAIQVDTLSPFACKPSQKYMVYLMGADASNEANYAKDIEVLSVTNSGDSSNTVLLDWDGKNDKTTSATYGPGGTGVFIDFSVSPTTVNGIDSPTFTENHSGGKLTITETGQTFRIVDFVDSTTLLIHPDDAPTVDVGDAAEGVPYSITMNVSLVQEHLLPHLWISPQAYWMWMYLPNYKDNEFNGANGLTWNGVHGNAASGSNHIDALGALPSKSYHNVTVTSTTGTPGATYNEWLFSNSTSGADNYTTTITGLNEAQWDLSLSTKEGIFDLQDFGFGDFAADEDSNTGFIGGHIGLASPTDNSYSKFRMPNVIETGALKPNDFVAMYITLKDTSIDHEVTINTRSASTETFVDPNSKEPIIGARFFDTLPQPIKDFKVLPYAKDAFIPEYTWSAQDADLWYGMMHYDTEPVHHQYHKAILHLPLNESASYMGKLYNAHPAKILTVYNYENGEKSHTSYEDLTSMQVSSGIATMKDYAWMNSYQTLTNPEGLAGNTVLFGGSRYLSGGFVNGGAGALFGRGCIAYPIGTPNLRIHAKAADYSGATGELKANFTASVPSDEFSLSMHITPDSKPPASYTLQGVGVDATFTLNEATTASFGPNSPGHIELQENLDDSETEIYVDTVLPFCPQYATGVAGSNAMRDDFGTSWVTRGEDGTIGANGSSYDIDDSLYILIGTEKMKVTAVNPGTLTQVTKVLTSCASTSNVITKTAHGLTQGTPVVLSDFTTTNQNSVVYYVSVTSLAANTFRLSTDKNGLTGNDVTITDDGTFTVTAAAIADRGWYGLHDGEGYGSNRNHEFIAAEDSTGGAGLSLNFSSRLRTNMNISSGTTPTVADKDILLLFGHDATSGAATSELVKVGRHNSSTPFATESTMTGLNSIVTAGHYVHFQDNEINGDDHPYSRSIGANSGLNASISHIGFLDADNATTTLPSASGEIILATQTAAQLLAGTENTLAATNFEVVSDGGVTAIYINETNINGLSNYSSVSHPDGQRRSLPESTYIASGTTITIEDPTDNSKWVQYTTTAVSAGGARRVAATYETTSMASTTGTTPGTVNIDSISITIPNSTSGAGIAAVIAGQSSNFPNYTAAVTNTDRVTFTERVAGVEGNVPLIASDRAYLTAALTTHTISKQGGGSPGDFSGGLNYQLLTGIKHTGGASGKITNTFTDNTRVIFTSEAINEVSGPVFYGGTLGTTGAKLYDGIGGGKIAITEGDESAYDNNSFIDDMGIWKVTGASITVERDITNEGADTHSINDNIYLLSDNTPVIGGVPAAPAATDFDDIDDSLDTAPIYDNINNDQLWRNALLQIGSEKFLFGPTTNPDGSNWNASDGWTRALEGTTWATHSADTITVIPRHYFFHSFTGNTVTNTGFDPLHDLYKPVVSAYLDSAGKINVSAYILNTSYKYPLTLKSKSAIPIDGQTPTHIGITFDSQSPSQNLKLYLNGKLEDAVGYRATTGTANNLQNDADGKGGEPLLAMGTVCIGGMPHQASTAATTFGTNGFDGAIEEVCLWDRVVDFVVPTDGKVKYNRPFIEIESGQSRSMSNTLYSRLFIKDYHNIRGKSEKEVTASPLVGLRKSAFALNTL